MAAFDRTRRQTIVLVPAAILLIVLLQPGLDGPLVLDSVKLYALEELVDEHGSRSILHTPGFGGEFGRIVSMATLVLDAQFPGEVSPRQFKATNVGLHVVTALLVFLLARVLVATTAYQNSAYFVALAASLIWLFSPLNINVVLYAIQRMAILSALFVLAGLVLYVAGRLADDTWRRRLYIGLAAAVCLPLACLSKENGVLLVPLAFLIEVFFLHRSRPWFSSRQLTSAAIVGVVFVLVAFVALSVLAPQLLSYEPRDFSMYERLLSQPRALMSYVWHVVVPLGSDVGIYTDGFERSRGLFAPVSTSLAIVAWLAVIAFCIRFRDGPLGFAAFGLAFFLTGHAIESTIVPLEMYFPHRNYLPDFGLYFAIAALLAVYVSRQMWRYIVLFGYCAWFATVSQLRAETWSARESIATAAIKHNPRSARAWSNFAQLATDSGQFDLAAQAVSNAVSLSGTLNSRLQQLYVLCRADREIAAARYDELTAIQRLGVSNEISQALGNLLELFRQGKCPQLEVPPLVSSLDKLAAHLSDAGLDPWTIEYYADSFLYAAGAGDRASERLAARLASGHAESGLYLAELLIDEGDLESADGVLKRVRDQLDREGRTEYDAVLFELEERVRN